MRDRIAGAEDDAATALSAVNTHTHGSTPPALPLTGGALSGALELPDGSAGAPSLTNTGDTNTGVFFPAADTVGIATASAERMRIDSAGRVSIGGVAPRATLNVVSGGPHALTAPTAFDDVVIENGAAANVGLTFLSGNATAAQVTFGDAGDNDIGSLAYYHTDDSMRFTVNAAERMRIDSAGLITGSGTSLGAWTAYTPTITASTGTFTTVVGTGWYCQIGKTVLVKVKVVITTNGTAAEYVIFTLPSGLNSVNTAGRAYGSGREIGVTGKQLNVEIPSNAGVGWVRNYDNTYPGASGYTLHLSATYEAA